VYSHCTNCHNEDGVAPFPLTTYDEVAAWKDLIYHEVVVEKKMPPWIAKSPHNAFIGDNSLSEEEIQLFSDWLDQDMPRGNMDNAPDIPVISSELEISNPDLVVEIDPYTVPDTDGNDLYRCFVFPVDFDQDMFLTSIEFIPDNKNAVHHILLYHDTGNTAINLDNADPEAGYSCFGGIGTNSAELLGGWAPGGSATIHPDGMGIKIPKNTNLVAQVHYPYYAEGQTDASKIHIKMTSNVNRELSVIPILNHFTSITNGPLVIQPNEKKTFFQQFNVPWKLTVTGVAPHAHLICNSLKSWLDNPDGTETLLVDIPNWDFEWQKFYSYKKPIIVEPGSVLRSEGSYDNTVNNPHNPSSPPKLVTVGESTTNEMMVFFYTFTGYLPGDEDLVFDVSQHHEHLGNCTTSLTGVEDSNVIDISVFPNPANQYIQFKSESSIEEVKMFDVTGKLVLEQKGDWISNLDVSELSEGTYVIQLKSMNAFITKSIIISKI